MIKNNMIPRSEYPRPQFVREKWLCLNGRWSYEFDFANTGMERNLYRSKGFGNTITVPFCPESALSGVEYKDFINAIWYHRKIEIEDCLRGDKIYIHFGASDYCTKVFIDGKCVGTYHGGSCSFSFDISRFVIFGHTHDLVVYVFDDTRDTTQPGGKQSAKYYSYGCFYTRVTGIWQTVWLEAVNECSLKNCRVLTDIDNSKITFIPEFDGIDNRCVFRVSLYDGDALIAQNESKVTGSLAVVLELEALRLWSPQDPFLYSLKYEVFDRFGNKTDEVFSYAGMRKIHIKDDKVYLNNEPLFQRLVLDQGYYPDGIWTAPSDEVLKNDIELGIAAGFNGARLHQKVFEQRYLYWADKLGYLVWAEYPSWGCDINEPAAAGKFLAEWADIIVRDRNHPCIITWTPFNETWERRKSDGFVHNKTLIDAYNLTYKLDGTRPVNDTSGHFHAKTDLWTVHIYDQNPQELYEKLTSGEAGVFMKNPEWEKDVYNAQPYILAEFGGIRWADNNGFVDIEELQSWGYGNTPQSIEEFYSRLEKLVDTVLGLPHISGYCYTQLTDVEQEHNGIYFYDRSAKFDIKRIKNIFSKMPFKVEYNMDFCLAGKNKDTIII